MDSDLRDVEGVRDRGEWEPRSCYGGLRLIAALLVHSFNLSLYWMQQDDKGSHEAFQCS